MSLRKLGFDDGRTEAVRLEDVELFLTLPGALPNLSARLLEAFRTY